MLKLLSTLAVACLTLLSVAAQPATRPMGDAQRPPDMPKNPALPTLWLIGDSTVRVGTAGQRGWGDELAPHFDTAKINIVNRAIGGRSSRTFRTDGRWEDILKVAKPGDYVLMQFGHNDAGKLVNDNPPRERGTIKGIGDETEEVTLTIPPRTGQKETVHTYGWYLRTYVQEAKANGMKPIVLSYIPRCPNPGTATRPSTAKVEVPAELSSYALWAQQTAEKENVPFLDLYRLILKTYVGKTPQEIHTTWFKNDRNADNTHTNVAGAQHNAGCVVEGIKTLTGEGSDLKQYLK